MLAEKLEIKKKIGDFNVDIRIGSNPPLVGKNGVEIEIWDASAAAVLGAKVAIQYYMPPMPRMPPMNFKIEAKQKKGKYVAALNLIMAGPWIVVLRIVVGEKTWSAKFSIDVR